MNKEQRKQRLIEKIVKLVELACEECDTDWPQFHYSCVGRCMEVVAITDGFTIRTVVPDDPKKWLGHITVCSKTVQVVGDPNQLIDRLQNVKDRSNKVMNCDDEKM